MMTFLKWFFPGLVLCAAVSVMTAILPSPVKKLGLFSLAVGMLVGVALSWLRGAVGKPARSSDFWLVLLLAGLTEAGRIAESYRQLIVFQRKALAEQLEKAAGFAAMLGPELEKQFEISWLEFLQLRYSSLPGLQLDHQSPAWSFALFCTEILLACAGAALAWRFWCRSQTSQPVERD